MEPADNILSTMIIMCDCSAYVMLKMFVADVVLFKNEYYLIFANLH